MATVSQAHPWCMSYVLFSSRGLIDCGLFAIAFATEVAYGGDPVVVSYQQAEMRNHLLLCFEKGDHELATTISKSTEISTYLQSKHQKI